MNSNAAHKKPIESEQRSALQIDYIVTSEDLTGRTIVWILQDRESDPDPVLIIDQDGMVVSGEKASVFLEPGQMDWSGSKWFELWIDWGGGQWQKQFKGPFTLNQSGKYNGN